MYLSFFGLNEKPFAITPDPRYLYLSERHAEALAHLLYGINEAGGFIQLTGEVGTGKTTIVRSLLAQTPKNAEIALILNPRMTPPEFLLTICEELGIGVPDGAEQQPQGSGRHPERLPAARARRRPARRAGGRRGAEPRARGARAGAPAHQPRDRTRRSCCRSSSSASRSCASCSAATSCASSRSASPAAITSIRCRATKPPPTCAIACASPARPPISSRPRRCAKSTACRGGVPRVINVICDRALLGAYTQDRHRVTPALVRHAAAEVFGRRFAPRWLPWAATAATGVALALGAWALWQIAPWSGRSQDAAAAIPAPRPTIKHTRSQRIERNRVRAAGRCHRRRLRLAATAGSGARAFDLVVDAARLSTRPKPIRTTLSRKLFSSGEGELRGRQCRPLHAGAPQGLECLVQRGSFGQLRLYNRPAILLLNDDTGGTHQVVLATLGDERAPDRARRRRGGRSASASCLATGSGTS